MLWDSLPIRLKRPASGFMLKLHNKAVVGLYGKDAIIAKAPISKLRLVEQYPDSSISYPKFIGPSETIEGEYELVPFFEYGSVKIY